MSQTYIQIVVEFRRDLFGHFNAQGWNAFIADLLEKNLIPPIYTPEIKPEPLSVLLDFSGLKRPHYHLDGIDLRMCWLEGASFEFASLRNARLGCGRNVSYRGSRLNGADFRDVEISGCEFSGATGLDTAMFDAAVYCPSNPPINLPPEILAQCKAEAEPPPDDRRKPSNPMEPSGFQQAPIRCLATINLIPTDPTHPTGEPSGR
jgi:hypothetical protein